MEIIGGNSDGKGWRHSCPGHVIDVCGSVQPSTTKSKMDGACWRPRPYPARLHNTRNATAENNFFFLLSSVRGFGFLSFHLMSFQWRFVLRVFLCVLLHVLLCELMHCCACMCMEVGCMYSYIIVWMHCNYINTNFVKLFKLISSTKSKINTLLIY